MNTTRVRILVIGLLALLVVAVVITVTSSGGSEAPASGGSGVDRAYTADMIPHHRSAVEMAEIAKDRSERPEIQRLADDIIRSQSTEIGQMRGIETRLADAGAKKGSLGAAHSMKGMGNEASLKTAEPFDRAFIDMMLPHHQSAIEMSRVELAEGSDDETKELATAIIAAQAKEIEQMNSYRKAWFGSASPSGGVPPEK